jgi:hypothetical protein
MMVSQNVVSEDDIILNEILSDRDIPGEPPFKAYVEATVYDKDGNIIQHHRQPMRSLTQYFLGLVAIAVVATYQGPSTNEAPPIISNIFGFPSQVSASPSAIWWSWSIQLGSGTQSFSPTLNSLAAPIANGSGSGQLQYGSFYVSYTATSIITGITVFNATATTVTVSEIGLFAAVTLYNVGTYNFLLSYDTFSTPISIPGNSFATFQIILSFSG